MKGKGRERRRGWIGKRRVSNRDVQEGTVLVSDELVE